MFNRPENNQKEESDAKLPNHILGAAARFEQTLNQILSCATRGVGLAPNMSHGEQLEPAVGMVA